jgi:hypothetical protein
VLTPVRLRYKKLGTGPLPRNTLPGLNGKSGESF